MSTPTRTVQVGDLWIETTPKGRELLLEVTSTSLQPRFAPPDQRFVELRNTISGRREVIDSAELHASDWLRPVL